jgi:ribulose-5-phosphate 4-epimerase/fuculose-1-phosphate aldolase
MDINLAIALSLSALFMHASLHEESTRLRWVSHIMALIWIAISVVLTLVKIGVIDAS